MITVVQVSTFRATIYRRGFLIDFLKDNMFVKCCFYVSHKVESFWATFLKTTKFLVAE